MKLLIDIERLKNELGKNFNELEITNIIETLCRFPLMVELIKGKIFSENNFEIELKPINDILTTSDFEVNIPGIDSSKIISVEIPKLSYDSTDNFNLKLEVFPFKIINFKNKK